MFFVGKLSGHAPGAYVIKFLKMNLFECLHAVTSSLRLFKVDNSGLQIIKNFSHKDRLHLLLAGLYGFARLRIFQVIWCAVLLFFRSQICLLSSVLDFLDIYIYDICGIVNCILKSFETLSYLYSLYQIY